MALKLGVEVPEDDYEFIEKSMGEYGKTYGRYVVLTELKQLRGDPKMWEDAAFVTQAVDLVLCRGFIDTYIKEYTSDGPLLVIFKPRQLPKKFHVARQIEAETLANYAKEAGLELL